MVPRPGPASAKEVRRLPARGAGQRGGLERTVGTVVKPTDIVKRLSALVLVALFVTVAAADAQPFRETLRWTLPLAASSAFDRQASLAWSSRPSNCTEGNLSRRNPDGTLAGWKATRDDLLETVAYAGLLYLTKRLHWRRAERFMQVAIVGRSAVYAFYGVKSLRQC